MATFVQYQLRTQNRYISSPPANNRTVYMACTYRHRNAAKIEQHVSLSDMTAEDHPAVAMASKWVLLRTTWHLRRSSRRFILQANSLYLLQR